MKKYMLIKIVISIFLPSVLLAQGSWQQVTVPPVREVASAFPTPPREYGAVHWAIWGGQQSKERILADIENVNANGASVYMINNSGGMRPLYFTPEYLELVKFVVDECKKRDMKVWIEDDGGYPSGFAGGMISKDYPELGMQAIVSDARFSVASGQTLDIPLPADTLGILASPRAGATASAEFSQVLPLPTDGTFKWMAPSGGMWEVIFQGAAGNPRYSVASGQTLTIPLPADTKSIRAGSRGRGGSRRGGRAAAPAQPSTVIPLPADGRFKWTAPGTGDWEVSFVRHVYRSSPTRFCNREDGTRDKDSRYSLIDYLDPEATATYIKLIHETYEKLVGDEFGKTILGFRGDEPDYTLIVPWTPKLLETFQEKKGYDLKPYIAQFFATLLTPEAQRAEADYWDVWSGMFRDNFYKPQQDWCKARNMEYMTHLNHEEVMTGRTGGLGEDLIRNGGSFWRDMRYVGVPGIDNLNQIQAGEITDFPKLASSAAHLFGRPMIWTEQGGRPGAAGKFVTDYQFVRGINCMNIRGLNTASSDGATAGWYTSRASYLLATGRPAAQVALYHPTDSMWLGDVESNVVTVQLTAQLMEQQIDFDYIDDASLASVCSLEGGGLKNLSGQVYRAVIVPTSTVIQKKVLERLRAFAAAGGKVVFVGRTPSMVADRTFLNPEASPDLSFATLESTPEITPRVVAALPKPDVVLDSTCPAVKYTHRSLLDAEMYFFFNESNQRQSRKATLAGRGQAQVWDANTGLISPVTGATGVSDGIQLNLILEPYEAKFIVIGPTVF